MPHERLGTLEEPLRRAGCAVLPFAVAERGATQPPLEGIAGVISMGGPQSASEQAAYPWMVKETALLGEAVRRGLPVLGICL
ncbi:MAG: glutamine amidotransferase, partial [Candidatus Omnitrophica bacterium]|nr:glutamine amidotransferase [Candidatus Omnitrophota bacterium]